MGVTRGWPFSSRTVTSPSSQEGLALILQAYFDESEREDGTFCVAGYVFFPAEAKTFEKEWSRLFGDRIFHMTDLAARRGEFSDLDQDEADRYIKGAVKLVRRRTVYGGAVALNMNELSTMPPIEQRGFRTAYSICCYLVALGVAQWARKQSISSIAYFFEAGNRHEAEANEFMRAIGDSPYFRERFGRTSYTFADKGSVRALEAADLFAWELAKQVSEGRERGSIVELSRNRKDFVLPLTGQTLRSYLDDLRDAIANPEDQVGD